MTKIFKILSLCLLALSFLSSCKKDSEKPATTALTTMGMKFSLNGNVINYNNCTATVGPLATTAEILITGQNLTGATPSADNFEIAILHDINSLKAGDVFQASATQYAPESMSFLYFPGSGVFYFITQNKNPIGTVTITNVSSTYISGTFSGTIFSSSDPNGVGTKYVVTNGAFTAKIN